MSKRYLEYHGVRITSAERVADRFVTTQVLQPPAPDDSSSLGELFILVEIARPWHMGARVGQALVNAAQRLYYRTASGPSYDRFETMLKGINQALARFAQAGETEWVGHLNSVIALIEGDEFHFTSAGTTIGYLWRDGELSPLVESEPTGEPHPLQTFGAITSGTLEANDRIFFANPIMASVVETDLAAHLGEETANLVATRLVRAAQVKKVAGAGGFILHIQGIRGVPQPHISVVYVDRPLESITTLVRRWFSKKALPKARELGKKTGQQASAAGSQVQKTVFPMLGRSLVRVGEGAEKSWQRAQKIKFIAQIAHWMENTVQKPSHKGLTVIRNYQEQTLGSRSPLGRVRIFGKTTFSDIVHALTHTYRIWTMATVGFILILILIINLRAGYIRRANEPRLYSSQELQALYASAESALAAQDQAQALPLLEQITRAGAVNQDADTAQIVTNARETYDQLTNSTRFLFWSALSERPEGADELVYSGDYLIAYDRDNGSLWRIALTGGTTETLSFPATSITSAIGYAKNDALFQSGTTLYRILSTSDPSAVAEKIDQTFPSAPLSGRFGSNIYFLDSAAGKIFVSSSDGQDFNSPREYPLKGVDLREAQALTIDGYIYVLKKDGTITKFSRGGADEFSLKNVPAGLKLSTSFTLFTDEALEQVFVLTRDARIMVFNKTGAYVRQIVLPTNSEINAATFSPTRSVIWVMNAEGIFEVSIAQNR